MLSGTAGAIQSRINGELGLRLGDGLLAANVSNIVGITLLLTALAVSPAIRAGVGRLVAAIRQGRLRWWMLLGGAAGAVFVFSQTTTAGVVGVALFSVAFVAGQTLSSLLVDLVGLGPAGKVALSGLRVLSAVLALAAVATGVLGGASTTAPWLLLFPFAAGIGLGWQHAVNGRVRAAASSAPAATLLNFAVGTAVLLSLHLPRGAALPVLPAEPWLYLGGPLGVFQVAVVAIVVRWTGVLLLGLGLIAGQMVAALALDLVNPAVDLSAGAVVGAALSLLAVVVASWPPVRQG